MYAVKFDTTVERVIYDEEVYVIVVDLEGHYGDK